MRDNKLTSHARFLWAVLDTYADKWGSHAFPSINTLRKISGHDRKWIFKYLNELEAHEWIKRSPRFKPTGARNSTLYIVIYPIYRVTTEEKASGKNGTGGSA